jgi:hypothetical protein
MAGQAAEDKEMIKSEKFTLEQAGGELSINKFFLGDEIAVEIVDKSGNKLLEMKGIGTQDKLFSLMGKATSLAVADVTGDQVPEVLASAFYGPASALYIFQFDAAGKKFVPVKFADSDDVEMHREFMVSDLPAENGADMSISEDLVLTARGKIYPTSLEDPVKAGEYRFKFADGQFKLIETREMKEESQE